MSPPSGAPASEPLLGPAPNKIAWRQSLAAGLLLGLALGCAWLARWTPRLYPRLLLALLATALALLGLAMLLAASEHWEWAARWQRRWHDRFGAASFPFFTALVVLALAALTSGNNMLYLLVSGLLAALAVSGAAAALNLSGLELTFDLPPELFAGRASPVRFTLANAKSWWPAYSLTVSASCRGGSDAAAGSAATMPPVYFPHLRRGAHARASGAMVFPRRGCYSAAAFVCATRFPFGLLQKRRRFQESGTAHQAEPDLLVYPAPASGLSLPPHALRRAAATAVRQPGQGQDLYRIREHVPGDSARQVDWKATARSGALQVRDYQDEQAPRVRLRLPLSPDPEAAISLCAGWVLLLSEQDVQLEFVGEYAAASGRELHLPFAPASHHRRPILEYLARIAPGPAAPAAPAPLVPSEVAEIVAQPTEPALGPAPARMNSVVDE